MKHALVLLALILLGGSRTPAAAAVNASFSFSLAKAPHALAPDPALSDPAWRAGEVPQNGSWWNVTARRPADDATTVYALYDDRNLYVAFVCTQPTAPIVATQETNDIGYGTDDYVAVGVDPSGAGSQAYLFETTPRGIRYEQANENIRFRPEWRAAASIEPGGWRAVMIIPR